MAAAPNANGLLTARSSFANNSGDADSCRSLDGLGAGRHAGAPSLRSMKLLGGRLGSGAAGGVPPMVTHCEQELQELMLQIDRMVQDKKCEWERDLELVQTRLRNKERECTVLSQQVQTAEQEVTGLRLALEEAQALRRQMTDTAEAQVETLRQEVHNMGRAHERLLRKHAKRQRLWERELLEARSLLHAAEAARGAGQLRDEANAAGHAALGDKCVLAQQQVAALTAQLERRRTFQDGADASLRAQVETLQRELVLARAAAQSQAADADGLRAELIESAEAAQCAGRDRDAVQAELRGARRLIARLEDEAARIAADRAVQEHALARREADVQHRLAQLGGAAPTDTARLEAREPELHRLRAQLDERGVELVAARDATSRAEAQLTALRQENQRLRQRPDVAPEAERLRAENRALTEFVAGVTGALSGGRAAPTDAALESANLSLISCRFLEEEEQRSRHLETLINGHIEALRSGCVRSCADVGRY